MPSIDDVFTSQFLRASDLKGAPRSAVIEAVAPEVIGAGSAAQQKLVVKFARIKPRLVLNRINATTIAGTLGRDYSQWVGKTVELRPEKTMFQNQLVDCIRVGVPAGAAPVAAAPFPPEAGNLDDIKW